MALGSIYRKLALLIPNLKPKLIRAGIDEPPHLFLKKVATSAFMLSFGFFGLFLAPILHSMEVSIKILFLLFPAAFVFIALYMTGYPDYLIKKKEKAVNKEIVFAVRFLIIEISSGVPIYNVFVNISKEYPHIGPYFKTIVDKVNLGLDMEEAIGDMCETVPSNNLRRILWQLLTSIRTGADIEDSLNVTLVQIIREQKIEVEVYGRKLNPLAMFYMMIAIIIPSLGITMLIIFAVFMGLELKLPFLLALAGLIAFMQYMFYALIKSSRPAVEM